MVYGQDSSPSTVVHANELNVALSDRYGEPTYHYHTHVVALPVVEKQVLLTKRYKSFELICTVKEVVQQVSHSKKWKSPQVVGKHGKPVYGEKGKAVLVPQNIYSILRDEFFQHMQTFQFTHFARGERGNMAESRSSL